MVTNKLYLLLAFSFLLLADGPPVDGAIDIASLISVHVDSSCISTAFS